CCVGLSDSLTPMSGTCTPFPYTTLFRSKTFSSIDEWATCHERAGVPLMATLTASTWVERDFTPEVLRQVGVRLALYPTQILLARSEEHTSELQSRENLVCRLLLEKKNAS